MHSVPSRVKKLQWKRVYLSPRELNSKVVFNNSMLSDDGPVIARSFITSTYMPTVLSPAMSLEISCVSTTQM